MGGGPEGKGSPTAETVEMGLKPRSAAACRRPPPPPPPPPQVTPPRAAAPARPRDA